MDDHHSPPSSKKSSAISKVDLVDTPRASPYRTRSRKNSNLTEENIAMHNESPSTVPTTRRVTRRMSQGSENAVTLTPMPQAAKRSRRSPSVASDDLVPTPKKKFHVAQENVVMEEDEGLEENVVMEEDEGLEENKLDGKRQSASLTENGSAQVVEVVDSEVTANDVDGSMSADNKMSIDSNVIDVQIDPASGVESKKVSKATEDSLNKNDSTVTTLDSDTSNVPVEISTINSKLSETSKANISDKLGKSASVASPMVQSLQSIGKSKSGSMSSPINSNVPESKRTLRSTRSSIVASNLEKSVSEPISTSVLNSSDSKDSTPITDIVKSSKELAEANFSLWLGNATNAKSDKFNSNVPVTPSRAAAETLTKSTVLQDVVTVPNTPKNPILGTPGKTLANTPSKAVSQVTPLVKSTVLQDDVNSTVRVTPTKSTPVKTFAKTPSKTMSLTTQKTPLVKSTVQPDDVIITVPDTPKNPILGTPGKTLAKTLSLTTQITPLGKSTVPQDDVNTTMPESQKNPILETPGKNVGHTPSKTVSVLVQETETVSDQMVPILETPSKTIANTPSKDESVVAQDPMTGSTSNKRTPSKTVPITSQEASSTSPSKKQLANGIENEEKEYPKWGFSVHRKSDGQPIDTFGMKKDVVETTTFTVKHSTKKNVSIISVNDSSEDDGPRNEFIDDEAEDTDGEDSMDEEERKYLRENEIPEDGISLGSDTDCEEQSDENESHDSFIVSDSESNQLLDGVGDDLAIDASEPTNKSNSSVLGHRRTSSKNLSRRSNKILDTSDEEIEVDAGSRKSLNSKKRSGNESSNKIGESSDESVVDELANLDAEPKGKAKSKRLSDTISLPKKDMKRRSLHPNTKLNSDDLKDDQSVFSENGPNAKESGEDDVESELANLDSKPIKATRSKRLSDTMISSKKDAKRISLHPNAKLNSGLMKDDPNKSMFSENGPSSDEQSKNDVEDELANLDTEPRNAISSKRLSDTVYHSKKDAKRLSLHPNAKLNSGKLKEDQNKSTIAEKNANVGDSSEEDITEVLANLDDVPKRNTSSKRLSEKMSSAKKDNKRLSLYPNAKINCDEFESIKKLPESIANESGEHTAASIAPDDNTNAIEKMEECNGQVDSAPNTSEQQNRSINFEAIQARCDDFLCAVNDAKREQKSTPKTIQEEKYQKLKEKKATKLQEKKDKEARMLQQEALLAKQRQLKREKKSNLAKVTDEEKSKAIEKALAFSNQIKLTKNQHSTEMKQESSTEPGGDTSAGTTPKKKNRKRKMLQIIEAVPEKKVRISQEQQVPAKPEGFIIHSRPIPNKKLRKDRMKRPKVTSTSAGNFTVEPMPKKAPSPFTVTTLTYSPPPSFKNKVVFNANVQRESAAQLLSRKKKQNLLQKY